MLQRIGNRLSLFHQLRYFCSTSNYQKYLGKHMAEALSNSIERHKPCLVLLQSAIRNSDGATAATKCKMLFEVSCLNGPLIKYHSTLSNLILDNTIQNKATLDRVIRFVTKEIKNNAHIDIDQINRHLKSKSTQLKQFEDECQSIEVDSLTSINQMCKMFREKYPSVDSKHIYRKVKQMKEENNNIALDKDKLIKTNQFWDKIGNIKPRILQYECNSVETYKKHLAVTEGKLRFRFPPEPNGYLHIGHVKSIRINFEAAKQMGGLCYLRQDSLIQVPFIANIRYDDTNPAAQSNQFISQIEENVRWLGYIPDFVTHASDYFQQMICCAQRLVQQGHAYVCNSTKEQLQIQRKNKATNKDRDNPIQYSKDHFPALQPQQTLRLKLNPTSPNPTLRDPIIYRRKEEPHPRTKSKYTIYPTYDFAHCICDSLQDIGRMMENIDYSLCSLEFEVRRELYYSILHLLKMYKPNVWEYSRLNVENNVLSKRKIKEMIEKNEVEGWDDARLLTIRGLRKRGYTPDVLFRFIDKVNASRSGNENVVQYSLLEKELKKALLEKAPKTMGVLEPHSIKIQRVQEQNVAVDLFHFGTQKRNVQVSQNLFVEHKDYLQLEENSVVILKYLGAFVFSNGIFSRVQFEKNVSKTTKKIHWISDKSSIKTKVTVFGRLLKDNGEINLQSKIQYHDARMPREIFEADSKYTMYQLQRIGFFQIEGNELMCSVML